MKYLSIIRYVLLAVSALVVVLYFAGTTSVDLMLRWAYVLLGGAAVLAVLMPLFNLAQNPKGALRSLAGLAIMAALLGVSYALSSDAPIVTAVNTFDDPTLLKVSDMGLFSMYAAMFAAVGSIVLGEIANIFK